MQQENKTLADQNDEQKNRIQVYEILVRLCALPAAARPSFPPRAAPALLCNAPLCSGVDDLLVCVQLKRLGVDPDRAYKATQAQQKGRGGRAAPGGRATGGRSAKQQKPATLTDQMARLSTSGAIMSPGVGSVAAPAGNLPNSPSGFGADGALPVFMDLGSDDLDGLPVMNLSGDGGPGSPRVGPGAAAAQKAQQSRVVRQQHQQQMQLQQQQMHQQMQMQQQRQAQQQQVQQVQHQHQHQQMGGMPQFMPNGMASAPQATGSGAPFMGTSTDMLMNQTGFAPDLSGTYSAPEQMEGFQPPGMDAGGFGAAPTAMGGFSSSIDALPMGGSDAGGDLMGLLPTPDPLDPTGAGMFGSHLPSSGTPEGNVPAGSALGGVADGL